MGLYSGFSKEDWEKGALLALKVFLSTANKETIEKTFFSEEMLKNMREKSPILSKGFVEVSFREIQEQE